MTVIYVSIARSNYNNYITIKVTTKNFHSVKSREKVESLSFTELKN